LAVTDEDLRPQAMRCLFWCQAYEFPE
jgi:hypothetical protein